MNKIVRIGEKSWRIEYEDGSRDTINRSASHDTRGKNESYWIYLPDNNPSNRGAINVVDIVNGKRESIEFPTVEKREKRNLSGSNWRSGVSKEMLDEYEKCQKRMEEIEKIGRENVLKMKNDPVEKIKAELVKKIAGLKELGFSEEQIKALLG